MAALFARLTVDADAVRVSGTFLNRKSEVRRFRQGQRVRVVRLCADRAIEVTDALDGVGGFKARVCLDQLDDLTHNLRWSDLTDKKGLP
jgi:NADH dehydrogenase/NADH:ubiquinone oxidoreductase subunit G